MNSAYPSQSETWPTNWKKAQQTLLAKTLSEFMYEEIIEPTFSGTQCSYTTHDGIEYKYSAERRIFNNYRVNSSSVTRIENGNEQEAYDPVQFLLDIQKDVDIQPFTMSYLIQEMNNTLVADTHVLERGNISSDELIKLDGTELEGWMHGHPWIIVNKGRIGFSYEDYKQFSPEMQQEQSLTWIAVDKSLSTFSACNGIDEQHFIQEELSSDYNDFIKTLTQKGLRPDDYRLMPIHDWQWDNKLVCMFSNEIGQQRIVWLGKTSDRYLPMQSIRTMGNITSPEKHYVKLPMSILNTAVYRGLPGKRTLQAPKLTQWVQAKAKQDPYITEQCRLILLGEVASINVDNPYCTQVEGAPYQFNELLGVIWRESIHGQIDEDEKAITMASLVHVDQNGKPFIQALIELSGMSAEQWLEQMLERTLPPLLHFLYKYGMVFSPHGENSILVMKDYQPERLAMKDFVDDINICDAPIPELADMPEELKKVLLAHPGPVLTHFIYTGLYVVHYRYLSDVLETYMNYPEAKFWQQVYQAIKNYQAQFPELAERFEAFPMEREEFEKVCLNRVRVLTLGYADDAERPEPDVRGAMPNPAHPKTFEKLLNTTKVA